MKVAIICVYAGKVERGVENWAFYLKEKLPFETEVFSQYASSWTKRVNCFNREIKGYKYWSIPMDIFRRVGVYRFLYQIEKLTPHFDIFNAGFLECYSFGRRIIYELIKWKPDIVINLSGSTIGYFLNRYRRKTGTKFISVSGAGKNITEIKNAKEMPDSYVVQTPSMKRFIKKHVPKVRVDLIPMGVDIEKYSNANKFTAEEIGKLNKFKCCRLENPIVLSTSALEKQKRLDYLIRAVAKLPKGCLIFAGDGTQRNYLLFLGRKLLNERFVYIGVIDKNNLPRVYKTCDVFCLPSINEPFGNVFVEALGVNKPVVADDDEDRRWIVGDAGILTDVRDVNKIADAIWKAYTINWNNRPLNQAQKFSWDNIITQYKNLIFELTGRKLGKRMEVNNENIS